MGANVTPATPAPIAQLRTLAGALISAVVMFGVVAFFTLGSRGYPPVWVPAGLGALALLVHGVAETVGYRTPALSPSDEPEAARAAGRAAYQSAMLVRFALCESVALIALVRRVRGRAHDRQDLPRRRHALPPPVGLARVAERADHPPRPGPARPRGRPQRPATRRCTATPRGAPCSDRTPAAAALVGLQRDKRPGTAPGPPRHARRGDVGCRTWQTTGSLGHGMSS